MSRSIRRTLVRGKLPVAGLAWLILGVGDLRAAPASSDPLILQQPGGERFEARVRGDEFSGWYETLDGHPIERDPASGVWVYRRNPELPQPRTPREPAVVGREEPPGEPWTPEEGAEAAELRRRVDASREEALLASHQGQATHRTRDFPPGPVPKKLLTVCVRFSDSPPASDLTPVEHFRRSIYDVTVDPTQRKSTVADYYLEVSNRKLLVSGDALGWIDLPRTTADYGAPTPSGQRFSVPRMRALVQNTVAKLGEQGFDFGPYDGDNDGFVDMLAIVFQGRGEADGGGPDTIWPHQDSYEGIWREFTDGEPLDTGDLNAEGEKVLIDLYFTSSELNRSSADRSKTVPAPIGTFCHEFAHALGLPDLYDREVPQTHGLGRWSLMAMGNYNKAHGQAGDCPAWPDPYCRTLLGWDREVNLTSSQLRLRIPEAKGPERVVYRAWNAGGTGPQFFLLETRKRTGFDLGLPGEGLLVYHVSINDRTVVAQNDNEWWQGVPGVADRTMRGHFLVALEQADGQFHLERIENPGDATDPFTAGGSFAPWTSPNSHSYPDWGAWGDGPPSQVAILDIDTSPADATVADIHLFEDRDRPVVTIADPPDKGPALGRLAEASGTVSDASAITGIHATLLETGPGGRYYDWVAGAWRDDLSEETRKPLAAGTAWSLALPAGLADGTYRLLVVATDATGLPSRTTVAQFTIDGELLNPTLALESPAGETFAESPLVAGTSSTPPLTTLTTRRFALYAEREARWYAWESGTFDSPTFEFARHARSVADGAGAWQFALPPPLANGRYRIFAQAVNDLDRGSPWASASFTIVRAPNVALESIPHQDLRRGIGTIAGTARPQGSYRLAEVRITLYRNGRYWDGAAWSDAPTFLSVPVAAEGGAWSYQGALPTEDGLYSLTASALDDQGSVSEPVGGGNAGQNQLLFHVDATPPSVSIQWPPESFVLETRTLDASSITGLASDASARPSVRVRLKRLADGLGWSRFGWSASEVLSWWPGAFPGEDGGSQVQWVMEGALPPVGPEAGWCLANGDYELEVEARDVVGNTTFATRVFSVQHLDPLLAGIEETAFLPHQAPIGPDPVALGSTPLAVASFAPGEGLRDLRGLHAIPGGRFGIAASRSRSLGYQESTRVPVLAAFESGRLGWNHAIDGVVDDAAAPTPPVRGAEPSTVDFGDDGTATSAIGLKAHDFVSGGFRQLPRCEVMRVGADGVKRWSRVLPAPWETQWQGGADASRLEVVRVRVLPDGSSLVIARLEAHDSPYWSGPRNFRHHVLAMLLGAEGGLQWIRRFGHEDEDERLHENESFLAAEPDAFGHVFVATKRATATGPEQVLRKIRLGDGATVSEHLSGPCGVTEHWGALAVDALGRPVLATVVRFGDHDARLGVRRLSANELIPDWWAFAPPGSAYHDPSWGLVDIPLLRIDSHGVTVVLNHPGSEGWPGDLSDRIVVARWTADGGPVWFRRLEPAPWVAARAGFAAVSTSGDVLISGDFAAGGSSWMPGYAKLASNGDLQFVKDLSSEFDTASSSPLAVALASDGSRLVAAQLASDGSRLELRALENPANRLLPPDLGQDDPADRSVALGGRIVLEAVNRGSAASVQWEKATGEGDFEAIPGASAWRLVIEGAEAGDAGRYRARATNAAGEATTRTATVDVATSPPILSSPLEATAWTGEFFSYRIMADHAPSSFGIVFDPIGYPEGLSATGDGWIQGFPSVPGTFRIQLSASNALGSDTRILVLTVLERQAVTLGEALDAPQWSWTQGGEGAAWGVEPSYRVEGEHAASAGAAPGSKAWIETTLTGPGTLSFWWAAYVTPGLSDRLVLHLDDVPQAEVGLSGYTRRELAIPAGTHRVRWSIEAGLTSDFYTTGYLDGVAWDGGPQVTGYAAWAASRGLTGADATALATPAGDGIPNLLKYAFHLDPTRPSQGPGRLLQPGTGASGLPWVGLRGEGSQARLRLEFLRRKDDANLRYVPQFSSTTDAGAVWESPAAPTAVETIDGTWERVVVEDPAAAGTAPRRFGRVKVERVE